MGMNWHRRRVAYLHIYNANLVLVVLLLSLLVLMWLMHVVFSFTSDYYWYERFGSAPRWAALSLDFAVGAWAWAPTRVNRRPPDARARARRGRSEGVWTWLRRCVHFIAGEVDVCEKIRTVFTSISTNMPVLYFRTKRM